MHPFFIVALGDLYLIGRGKCGNRELEFLDTFTKLHKKGGRGATISCVMCVSMEHLSSHWMDFHEI